MKNEMAWHLLRDLVWSMKGLSVEVRMEKDRYQQNHTLFIVGLSSLVISLTLLAFTFYNAPYLLFHLRYDVADFVISWQFSLSDSLQISDRAARMMLFLIFFALTLIFGLIAFLASNWIDNSLYPNESEITPTVTTNSFKMFYISQDLKESVTLFAKILILVLIVFVVSTIIDVLFFTET